jgi:hypothetical protein
MPGAGESAVGRHRGNRVAPARSSADIDQKRYFQKVPGFRPANRHIRPVWYHPALEEVSYCAARQILVELRPNIWSLDFRGGGQRPDS